MTDKDDDRELASTIIRAVSAGAGAVAARDSNPIVRGAATGAGVILELVASLVENFGRGRAEEILQRLVANPAKPVTLEQLADDVERLKAEFGLR